MHSKGEAPIPSAKFPIKEKRESKFKIRTENVSHSGFHATLTHAECDLCCDLITNRAELANSSVGLEVPLF